MFTAALQEISTAKEKIFELSSLMLRHQQSDGASLVSLWLAYFKKCRGSPKKLALLFLMNDVLMKSVGESAQVYLQEFSKVLEEVIEHLQRDKSKELLHELEKIINIWQRPAIFVQDFTNFIKGKVTAAIDEIRAQETGATVIQEFVLAQRLVQLDSLSENLLEQAKREDLYFKQDAVDPGHARVMLMHHKETAENVLVQESQILLELAALLEANYEALTS